MSGVSGSRGADTTDYRIRDTEGRLLAVHVREDRPDGTKAVRWQRPDGSPGLNGTPLGDLPLYGAHELGDYDPDELIALVEGEKARDALAGKGIPALGTVTGASSTPSEATLAALRGRRVALWPDHDEQGHKHMHNVAERLHGLASELLWYEWPEAEEKGDDAADHPALQGGGSAKAVGRLRTDLEDAPRWRPPKALRDEGAEGYMRTDLGNAERFVDSCGEDVRWCTEANLWMLWDGTRWCWDEGAHATHRLAHKCVRSIFEEAQHAPDNQEAKAIAAHAVASQSASRIEAMLSQAKPYLNISMDDLDRDIWLVNARNGTLDLRTGQLREHDREDLITKSVPFDYDPEASAPRFTEFMEQVLPDPEVRAFVQRYAGYSLTGSTRERVLAFLHGGGKNGKSTLVEALREAAGEYAQNTTVETILSSRGGSQIPNDVAALKGARLVSAAEPEKNRRMAESKVKNLTGSDTVTARFMRGEFFDFKPEFKLWISMNHKPIIVGTDDAIWDRIRLVPFGQRFEGEDRDPKLPDKLREELPGIFSWMVRGALEWYEHGLGCPEAVAVATREYREEMDTLGDFLEARCVLGPNATAPAADLYKQYEMWCSDAGEHPEAQRAFGMRLTERGFDSFRYSGGVNKGRKGWRGIGIQSNYQDPQEGSDQPESERSADNRSPGESPIDKPDYQKLSEVSERSEPKNAVNSSKNTREEITVNSSSLHSLRSPERVAELFSDPPSWLQRQQDAYFQNPGERLLKPLCAAVAAELGTTAEAVRPDVRYELGEDLVRAPRDETPPTDWSEV